MTKAEYTDPLGRVYREDTLLNRWLRVPSSYLLAEEGYFSQNSTIIHQKFCLHQNVPIIALNSRTSLAVLEPLDKEGALWVLRSILKEEAYIPNHRILEHICADAILELKALFHPCFFASDENRQEPVEEEKKEMLRKILEIQQELEEDDPYAYEEIILLQLEKYLSETEYMIYKRYIVHRKEYENVQEYIRKYPRAIYCSIDKRVKGPVNIGRAKNYSDRTQSQERSLWNTYLPRCLIYLSGVVITSMLEDAKKERKKEILHLLKKHMHDVGRKKDISVFFNGLFIQHKTVEYEAVLLDIRLEEEHKKLAEAEELLSETEEGEIK